MPEPEVAQVALLSPDDPVEDAAAVTPLEIRRSRRGWPRGYQPPEAARSLIKTASRTNLARSILTALVDLSALLALTLAGAAAWTRLPWPLALAVSVLAVLVIGRFGRAQECLVHEASHRNWQRNGRWNDLLANVLAGFPTASQVGSYRRSHVIHHAHLGCAEDPDIQRYEEFNLEELTGLGGRDLVRGIVRRLPKYNWGWYTTIGTNPVTLVLSGTWFLVVFGIVALFAGPGFAFGAWAHWLIGYALVLPTIRMIGEAGEHRYSKGDTVFNSTISNLGWAHRWIVHPHGDGHHTLHHLWSSVPHHRIRETHEALAGIDTETYAKDIYWRTKVLENVRHGLSAR
ncbi:MAG: fatty acid desaturase [Acidimicrobiales bacterium]